jgi:hypothetical protein
MKTLWIEWQIWKDKRFNSSQLFTLRLTNLTICKVKLCCFRKNC